MSEINIIKGCSKNDRESQKALFETFYSKMLGVSCRYASNIDEAKDMLQQGFLKVFENIKKYNNKEPFEYWLKKIIIKTAIDYLRNDKQKYKIVSTVYANEKSSSSMDDVDETDLFSHINQDEVLKVLQELTPAYRIVYNLFVIEQYTPKEISELLGTSEETAKLNLAKAKFDFKKTLIHSIK